MRYKTKSEYNEHCTGLEVLRHTIKHNPEISIKERFSKSFPVDKLYSLVLISDVYDGEEYDLEVGKFYPANLVLNIIKRLRIEHKTPPVFHSDYDSLDYHVSYVNSRDYRFIFDIDSLPANTLEAREVSTQG